MTSPVGMMLAPRLAMRQNNAFDPLWQQTRAILARAKKQRQDLEALLNQLQIQRLEKQQRALRASIVPNVLFDGAAQAIDTFPHRAMSAPPRCAECRANDAAAP
jgi:hypothetical protein